MYDERERDQVGAFLNQLSNACRVKFLQYIVHMSIVYRMNLIFERAMVRPKW